MDEIRSHHFETMVETSCLLAFAGESSFEGVLGGAGVRPSTAFGGVSGSETSRPSVTLSAAVEKRFPLHKGQRGKPQNTS